MAYFEEISKYTGAQPDFHALALPFFKPDSKNQARFRRWLSELRNQIFNLILRVKSKNLDDLAANFIKIIRPALSLISTFSDKYLMSLMQQ